MNRSKNDLAEVYALGAMICACRSREQFCQKAQLQSLWETDARNSGCSSISEYTFRWRLWLGFAGSRSAFLVCTLPTGDPLRHGLFAMVAGAALGHDWPQAAIDLRVLGQIFLRLIKTIIAPLLFATLVSGIASHSDLRKVGRMGIKGILYFEIVTTLALFIGLAAINLSKAGQGAVLPSTGSERLQAQKLGVAETVLHIFPENIAKSIAEGQILQVVVFSILFGIALAMVREERRRPLLNLTEGLAETMFKFTNIVMYFALVGVGAAIACTVGTTGMGVLVNLAKLLLTLYVALIIVVFGVFLPSAVLVRVPLRRFMSAVAEPVSIAFGTASSEAALPSAMEALEEMGVPRAVVAFVMPTGYSFNLVGSTLYLSLASIFVAQVAGVHLSFGQQLLMMLTLMLTSKGVAGISRAAIVILLGTVGTFGLPVEPVFILLGIDQLMDMGRTAVNVLGNCLATVVVARWEGEFPGESQLASLNEAAFPVARK
jgi:proton glutamate symport protein